MNKLRKMFYLDLSLNMNEILHFPLSKVILWKPVHGHRGRGRPKTKFVDNLLLNTGVETTGKLEYSCLAEWCGEGVHPGSSGSSR